MSSLLQIRWNRRRNDLHPSAGTLLHIWIIALGFPAVIPVTLLLLFLFLSWLNIDRRLLLDHHRG
jgi:hypothetical protein